MLYIFLSICCSVIVSVLLKLARRYQIDIYQAITWNYSMAVVLTWLFLKPQFINLHTSPFYVYAVLGILLPALFVVIAISVIANGIVRTEVAQRLSLFTPVIASVLLFGEHFTVLKYIGIGLGFAAILCSIPWKKERSPNKRKTANAWAYLLVIFAGMGVIDILFKQMAMAKGVSFSTSLFLVYVISFVVALIGLVYRFGSKQAKFSLPHIGFGWILGVANFGNILFYIRAHQALKDSPSVVFSAMNIGVIVLGSAIGILIFREKLSLLNKVGIGLAIIAIIVISFAKIH